jgi:ABC-type glycerol-3-phosphate transport system substrate-binding protein
MIALKRPRLAPAAVAFIAATLLGIAILAGCGQKAATTTAAAPERPIDFKIGVMTGTVSQGEDEYRAAQMLTARFGADHVKHVTYPDNFMNEQETVIAQLVGLADDPEVKVIIAGQAIPGSIAALRKIREKRPDIKIAFIEPHEDPAIVNAEVDLSIQPDQLARGRTIVEVAKNMGVTDFVHYSFPRHMSQELLARRRDIMKQACADNGMTFHFVTAPDPMAEGGLAASQQFITEDVPREIRQHGEKTGFFSTNCGMQDPLIRTVLQTGGYVPEQCCPSPTHGYPTALGIAIPPDKAGDFEYISAENRRVIAEHGKTGHFATWPVPEVILSMRAAADLLADAVEGKADYKDAATVKKYLEEKAGVPVTVTMYDENKGNSYLLLVGDIYY